TGVAGGSAGWGGCGGGSKGARSERTRGVSFARRSVCGGSGSFSPNKDVPPFDRDFGLNFSTRARISSAGTVTGSPAFGAADRATGSATGAAFSIWGPNTPLNRRPLGCFCSPCGQTPKHTYEV